ncbi:MAG TPA: inorganic diphosphatase [Patescibacteria group bacterium]|nr:inorganic diphosphatase [Patescibacteria group bacterium]
MSLKKVPFGELDAFHVIIEVPAGSSQRYEHDHELDVIKLVGTLHEGVVYPFNYGYVPQTESGDGAPLDAFVVSAFPIARGTVAECRAIGMIELLDRGHADNKIIAVPTHDRALEHIRDLGDLPVGDASAFREFYANMARQWQRDIIIKNFLDKAAARKELLRTQISGD